MWVYTCDDGVKGVRGFFLLDFVRPVCKRILASLYAAPASILLCNGPLGRSSDLYPHLSLALPHFQNTWELLQDFLRTSSAATATTLPSRQIYRGNPHCAGSSTPSSLPPSPPPPPPSTTATSHPLPAPPALF